MKKKMIIAGICAAGLFAAAGCGAALPDMTEEQEDAVVEYAAEIVMRYTRDYDSRLVDLSLYEEKEETPETGEDNGEEESVPETSDTPVTDISQGASEGDMARLLLPEGMDLRFTGYRITDTYPDGDDANPYFALDASAGNRIVVLEFDLENGTGARQEVDIYSLAPRFTLLINETEKTPVLATMLLDDLSTYVGSVEAGETVRLVLTAEAGEELAGNISSMRLSATVNGNSVVIPLE